MYRDLGFIRVGGRLGQPDPSTGEAAYAYLIYPHKPIVAYVPKTRRLLSEYCVEFPDLTRAISRSRLPDSDDVLAKWMALTGDEQRLISTANMHLPGRQLDPVAAALEDLNRQVALIRKMAEEASRQDREIRLLRETIARLRGAPVATAAPWQGARDSSPAPAR